MDLAQLVALSPEEKLEVLELLELRDRRIRRNWLRGYAPYKPQLKFHEAGQHYRERLFMAGNQLGKTWSGAAEVAMHLTGRYPAWWPGIRFKRATSWLVGSESGELTRKGVQRLLLGPPQARDQWGTGAIPHDTIVGTSMKQGVPDAVASITVKNEYGGESIVQFNSYDQGRTKWQADTVDGVWFDEEPPMDVYTEGVTRTNATGGIVFVTFTPLLGMSAVVKRFLQEKPVGTHVTQMTIDDAEHYTPEERARIIAGYPEHEREARARGIPIMGSGLVFPVAESIVACDPFPIPAHWGRINGVDFGWDHPAGFVAVAHDRDTDTAYVYDAWRVRNAPVLQQSGLILAKGYASYPTAWPHDGLQHDKGSGEQLKEQYKKFGIRMLAERAQFEPGPDGKPGGNSVEAGVAMMLTRMQARQRLVRGVPPIPPQGRDHRQAGRRHPFGHPLRADDAALREKRARDRCGESSVFRVDRAPRTPRL
jgi:phage terminase large subunit-like protein